MFNYVTINCLVSDSRSLIQPGCLCQTEPSVILTSAGLLPCRLWHLQGTPQPEAWLCGPSPDTQWLCAGWLLSSQQWPPWPQACRAAMRWPSLVATCCCQVCCRSVLVFSQDSESRATATLQRYKHARGQQWNITFFFKFLYTSHFFCCLPKKKKCAKSSIVEVSRFWLTTIKQLDKCTDGKYAIANFQQMAILIKTIFK